MCIRDRVVVDEAFWIHPRAGLDRRVLPDRRRGDCLDREAERTEVAVAPRARAVAQKLAEDELRFAAVDRDELARSREPYAECDALADLVGDPGEAEQPRTIAHEVER